MIKRDLRDGTSLFILQEDHADLAAQFAAHWGNEQFAKLEPYESMVFAGIYHDSDHRETEADVPMDSEKGLPHGHRTVPFSPRRPMALLQNIDWVTARDPYAGLIVSMHHTGLAQGRYNLIQSWQTGSGTRAPRKPIRPEMEPTVKKLEASQQEQIDQLERTGKDSKHHVWVNYRLFQVFDLLSLYFCCDGYEPDGSMKAVRITPVPTAYDSGEEVELDIIPSDTQTVRIDPYPFDASPLNVAVMGRVMSGGPGKSEAENRLAFHRADRRLLNWKVMSASEDVASAHVSA
jgi:hypothetical protein